PAQALLDVVEVALGLAQPPPIPAWKPASRLVEREMDGRGDLTRLVVELMRDPLCLLLPGMEVSVGENAQGVPLGGHLTVERAIFLLALLEPPLDALAAGDVADGPEQAGRPSRRAQARHREGGFDGLAGRGLQSNRPLPDTAEAAEAETAQAAF